jgi:hypothetical protein
MVHVPAGVPAVTDWTILGPICQFNAVASTVLPGARKRTSKYVCAVKFKPKTVETYDDPTRAALESKVRFVTTNGVEVFGTGTTMTPLAAAEVGKAPKIVPWERSM